MPQLQMSSYAFDVFIWDWRFAWLGIPPEMTLAGLHRWLRLVLVFSQRELQSVLPMPRIAWVDSEFVGVHMAKLDGRLGLPPAYGIVGGRLRRMRSASYRRGSPPSYILIGNKQKYKY